MKEYGLRVNGEIIERSNRYPVLLDKSLDYNKNGDDSSVVDYLGETQFGETWSDSVFTKDDKKFKVVLDLVSKKYVAVCGEEVLELFSK
jgi:hypothetical protein